MSSKWKERFEVYSILNPHRNMRRLMRWHYSNRGKISLSKQRPKPETVEEKILLDEILRSSVEAPGNWLSVWEMYVNQWVRM